MRYLPDATRLTRALETLRAVQDADEIYTASQELRTLVNGVIIQNLTMEPSGPRKLQTGPAYSVKLAALQKCIRENQVRRLRDCSRCFLTADSAPQQRTDVLPLVHEVVDSPQVLRVDLVPRFLKLADQLGFTPALSLDSRLSDPALISRLDKGCLGAMKLLETPAFREFVDYVTPLSIPHCADVASHPFVERALALLQTCPLKDYSIDPEGTVPLLADRFSALLKEAGGGVPLAVQAHAWMRLTEATFRDLAELAKGNVAVRCTKVSALLQQMAAVEANGVGKVKEPVRCPRPPPPPPYAQTHTALQNTTRHL